MIDYTQPLSQKSKFTSNRSELLVSYDVTNGNRNYEFDNVVFGYIKKGIKKIHIQNEPLFDFLPGMVIMATTKMSANVSVPSASINNPVICYSLEISKEQVWKKLDKINETYGLPQLVKEEKTLPSTNLYYGKGGHLVLAALNNIQDLLTEDVAYKDYWIDLKIEELILFCLQTNMHDTLIHSYQKNRLVDHPLAFAIHYIKENLYSKIDVETLANKAYMSKATFFRQFKHHFGMTPIHFIHSERIKEAQILLKKTNKSVSEIGYNLGYTTPSYFALQFERMTGLSPKSYKKRSASL